MSGIARRNGYYVDSFIKKFDDCKDSGKDQETTKNIMTEFAISEIRKSMESGERPLEVVKDIKEIFRMFDTTIEYYLKHIEH